MSTASLGLLAFIAARGYEQRLHDELREAGFEATVAQFRLAARIDEDGSRLTDLARAAQVTKQTAGFLVDQLERDGYVERHPDPADARARLVKLAPRGRAAQQAARQAEQRLDAEWAEILGGDGALALRDSLERLRPHLDPYAPRNPLA